MRSLSTVTKGKSVAFTKVEENNISLPNSTRILPFPSSSSCHHIREEFAHNMAHGYGGVSRSDHSRNCSLLFSPRQSAVALMPKLNSANHKKINAITHCLFSPFVRPQVHVLQGVFGKDYSSSTTIKSTNRDNIASLASFHTKPNCTNGHLGLTSQPAQPNSRPSNSHDAPPDQPTVSQRGALVSDNFSTFTSSIKQKLDIEASLEPLETTSSEYSACASFYSNKMNSKRNCWQTGDSESHSNDDDQSNDANALATPPGTKGMKRKRAAQVHKLSEKRRRDKFNTKLRALQDLIPNCTKMDKASVLEEAIDYVKSLQLQLQIMSIFAGSCASPTQMTIPACYPAIGTAIALRLGMGSGCGALQLFSSPFSVYGTRLQMPWMHHQ